MNKSVIAVLLAIVAIFAILLCGCTQTPEDTTVSPVEPAATGEKVTYIIGIDGEYPPYSYIDKDGSVQGLDVESAKWIANELGFEVKFLATAWDGIIPALNAGKIDMVYSGMTITDERSKVVNFSNPYLLINQSVAINNDSGLTMDDFMAGKGKIGAQRGTTGAFWVEEELINKGITDSEGLVLYDNFPLVVTDLANNRLDFIIYDKPPMVDAIEGKSMSILGEIDTGEKYGIAIRKEDTELLNTMNHGLDLLMNSPKWNELLTKYEMV